MEAPKVPSAQIVYGRIIYWLCIIAAVICTAGSTLAVVFPGQNVMDPHYLFFNIWQGNKPKQYGRR